MVRLLTCSFASFVSIDSRPDHLTALTEPSGSQYTKVLLQETLLQDMISQKTNFLSNERDLESQLIGQSVANQCLQIP